MANPFPFTAGQVLTAAQMNGIGETLAYTPTLTNLTLGNGTLTASYVRAQNLVFGTVELTFGTTTVLTGQPTFTLPVNAAAVGNSLVSNCVTNLFDAGVAIYVGGAAFTTTTIAPWVSVASTAFLTTPTGNVSATSPFVWGNGDQITMRFVYGAA
jgi:hypothetical protein